MSADAAMRCSRNARFSRMRRSNSGARLSAGVTRPAAYAATSSRVRVCREPIVGPFDSRILGAPEREEVEPVVRVAANVLLEPRDEPAGELLALHVLVCVPNLVDIYHIGRTRT